VFFLTLRLRAQVETRIVVSVLRLPACKLEQKLTKKWLDLFAAESDWRVKSRYNLPRP